MMGIERSRQREAVSAVLERVGLLREAADRVRGFSAGMRRRLALARLLLHPPKLLLLDEPYASFDAEGVELVNAFALDVARAGGVALVATHDLTRAVVSRREVRIEDGRAVTMRLETAAVRPAVGRA
jgi:heme exporter protein A